MEKQLQVVEDLSTFINELTFDEKEVKVEISDQAVLIENIDQARLSNIYKKIAVDSLDIFELEVELNLLHSSEDGGFGLILGWDGQFTKGLPDNYLRLLVEPSGKFSLDYFNNEHQELIAVEHSAFINQGPASNKIAVQKSGSEIHFFANGNLIFTLQEVTLAGTQFGFIVGPLTTISINSFYFASPEITQSAGAEEVDRANNQEVTALGTLHNYPGDTLYYPPVRKRNKFRFFLITLLLVAWGIGFLVYHGPGLIHILLVIALLLMIFRRKSKRLLLQ